MHAQVLAMLVDACMLATFASVQTRTVIAVGMSQEVNAWASLGDPSGLRRYSNTELHTLAKLLGNTLKARQHSEGSLGIM
jgi:hypothetical protein